MARPGRLAGARLILALMERARLFRGQRTTIIGYRWLNGHRIARELPLRATEYGNAFSGEIVTCR